VVMGPHTFNFADAAELALASGAAIRVATIEEAIAAALALGQGEERRRRSVAGLAFASEHRGAAARMAEAILRRLPGA
jgi:3-deoxy-D-manno-octulosonic-acid transferase